MRGEGVAAGKQQCSHGRQCGLAGTITILSLAKAHRLKKNGEERKIQREERFFRLSAPPGA